MKYLWKDSIDENTIHFGIQYKKDGKINNWFSVFIDAIFDMFDEETCDIIKSLEKGIPKEIDKLNLTIK